MRLYLHWPFCPTRCSYCDFDSRVAGRRHMGDYRLALLLEMDIWMRMLEAAERKLTSVYMGGGTPSTMSGADVSGLLREVSGRFEVMDGAEVTVEVNPATWGRDDFAAARAGGVNRISVGVQSLHDPTLRMLGRAHDAGEAREAVEIALRCGADSVSVDIMFGLPGMDTFSLLACLDDVLAMGPHHLSLYALTLHERAPLSRAPVRLPGDDEAAEQYLAAAERLAAAGYEHYEISNFCLPGHRCRHNMAYWNREQYLGLGAAAHSLLGRCRLRNTSSMLGYVKALSSGRPAVEGCELLGEEEEREEAIILGLRTSLGATESMVAAEGGYLRELESEGLLERRGGRVTLTDRGMFMSNTLILALLPA